MPKTGVWKGWYCYDGDPEKHAWHFAITVTGTRFSGKGHDDVGGFGLSGQMDGDGVRWIKRYWKMDLDPDDNGVHHRGTLDAEGQLAGEWKLSDDTRGTWGAHWTDAEAPPARKPDAAGEGTFDTGSFLELIREIQPLVRKIEAKYRKRFPTGLPHWTELPEDALAELPGGDDAMNDLFGFFTAIDEHVFDRVTRSAPPR